MSLFPVIRQSETVKKGWGEEKIFASNDRYCGKLLCYKAGHKMSMHYHLVKEESFYCLEGKLKLTFYNLDNADLLMREVNVGDIIDIPVGCPHQLEALEDSVIIEVSTKDSKEDNYRVAKGSSQLSDYSHD